MATGHEEREFPLAEREFKTLCQLATNYAGIQLLGHGKEDMVYGRLSRRLRALGLDSFRAYVALLESDAGQDEFEHFINALTTNLTAFFREKHHFEYLASTVLPALMKRNAASRKMRIWSAGCSTGEEPYSIAMTVAECVPEHWDVRILATDLDSNVLAHAERGVYDESRVSGISKTQLHRWFMKGSGSEVRVKDRLRDMIHFRPLNLLHDWPMRGPLDVIFCRNVIIYFDNATKAALAARYAKLLHEDGTLFIGHSETLFKVSDDFSLVEKTIYQKCAL